MDGACAHHWILGQPEDGVIPGECRKCGATREFPAVLDELDAITITPERRSTGVATAVGGARPSSVAALRA